MNSRKAMFAGTFDPPTLGHLDIIRRTASMYDDLYVVIGDNISKNTMFSVEERHALICDLVKDIPNVHVEIWHGLTVDFALNHDIKVMIRGIRNWNDFDYECELADVNKQISPEVETMFLACDEKLRIVRSSTIKEMAHYGADISKMVPPEVCRAVISKVKC